MATARGLINGSLRLLGVLAEGEAVSASGAQDALASFNSMIESWSTESLSVMGVTERIITLTTAKQVYTIGPGGDIDIPRPTAITDFSVAYQNAPQDVFLPLYGLSLDQYSSIAVIGYQTPIPQGYFLNPGIELYQLFVYPVPQAGTRIRFYTSDLLDQVPSINQTLVLAPGYERAFRYNLAIELAPEYGKDASASVVAIAQQSKENIQRLNATDITLVCDVGLPGGSFNRITGEVG
jgi:hypothetical protein